MPEIERFVSSKAPKPLGRYTHANAYGDLVFVAGMASRHPETNQVPGLVVDDTGTRLEYDIRAETRGTLDNIRAVVEEAGSDLDHVLEIQVFLRDIEDFSAYNEEFAKYFPGAMPARTTIGVAGLPGDISIEMRAVAVRKT